MGKKSGCTLRIQTHGSKERVENKLIKQGDYKMINTNLIQTRDQEILEVNVMCFMCEMLESKNELAIITYGEESPKKITVGKDFGFTVENNRLEIYCKEEDKAVFTLENLTEYDFIDWDEHIKFYSLIDNTVIKIANINDITDEEDALCVQ